MLSPMYGMCRIQQTSHGHPATLTLNPLAKQLTCRHFEKEAGMGDKKESGVYPPICTEFVQITEFNKLNDF